MIDFFTFRHSTVVINKVTKSKGYLLHKCDLSQSALYQILEITEEYPEGRTCGEYFKKKDAVEDLIKLCQQK